MRGLGPSEWLYRARDVLAASAGLVLLSPLLGALALILRAILGPPVFFTQLRPGLHGKLFRLYKFRTMNDGCTEDGMRLPDAERLSAVGKGMRGFSLDELPGLLNVLKGEMSLVGPRPLLPQYLGRYTPEQARRHEVKPGITGWAQVNGRNAISWEEKFALDVWYVDNRSFLLDLKILAMTAWKVLKGEGISAPGEATMPEFVGSGMRSREAE